MSLIAGRGYFGQIYVQNKSANAEPSDILLFKNESIEMIRKTA